MAELRLASDNPIRGELEDYLDFKRYLDPLVAVITNPHTETPFTVGIFGTWGSGKTSLLRLFDSRLQRDYKDRFLSVWFNPWIHRAEPSLLIPLLHALHDTLDEQPVNRFKESAKKIGSVLVRLGAGILLKHLTAKAASMEDLDKLEESYLKTHGRVESEMRNLRKTLQAEVTKLADGGTKLVLFVDDLDRCQPAQIIDLLEAIKLFFDLEHLFIILAVDKEVVDRGVQIKYKDFKFAEGRAPAIGAEYLEKMVQLPLSLFPLHSEQVKDFVAKFNPPAAVQPHLSLLVDLLDPNPRKIKRVLNILTIVSEVAASTPALKSLKADLVARFVVLQVQSGEVFSEIVKQPELLLALESTYAGHLKVEDAEAYHNAYGSRASQVQTFCQTHYRPGSYLGTLFKGEPFKPVAAQFTTYLAMFGGTG